MSQKDEVLEYLQSGGTLTVLQALRMFGAMRLPARIKELKKEGWTNIETKMIKVRSGKRVGRYQLRKGK